MRRLFRILIVTALLPTAGCVSFRHPAADKPWTRGTAVGEYAAQQAAYCTALHDELNEDWGLNAAWWTSGALSALSGLAGAVSAAVLIGEVRNGAAADPGVVTTLATINSGAFVIGASSGVAFTYLGAQRDRAVKAKQALLKVRDSAIELSARIVEYGGDEADVISGIQRAARQCYETRLHLALDSEAQAIAFLHDMTSFALEAAKERITAAERQTALTAREVAESSDATLLETLRRVRDGDVTLESALERLSEASLQDSHAELGVANACLAGMRVIDDQELVIPPGAVLVFLLRAAPDGAARTESAFGSENEAVMVSLKAPAGGFASETLGPFKTPTTLLIGDAWFLASDGTAERTSLAWPRHLSPRSVKGTRLPIDGGGELRVSWRCGAR